MPPRPEFTPIGRRLPASSSAAPLGCMDGLVEERIPKGALTDDEPEDELQTPSEAEEHDRKTGQALLASMETILSKAHQKSINEETARIIEAEVKQRVENILESSRPYQQPDLISNGRRIHRCHNCKAHYKCLRPEGPQHLQNSDGLYDCKYCARILPDETSLRVHHDACHEVIRMMMEEKPKWNKMPNTIYLPMPDTSSPLTCHCPQCNLHWCHNTPGKAPLSRTRGAPLHVPLNDPRPLLPLGGDHGVLDEDMGGTPPNCVDPLTNYNRVKRDPPAHHSDSFHVPLNQYAGMEISDNDDDDEYPPRLDSKSQTGQPAIEWTSKRQRVDWTTFNRVARNPTVDHDAEIPRAAAGDRASTTGLGERNAAPRYLPADNASPALQQESMLRSEHFGMWPPSTPSLERAIEIVRESDPLLDWARIPGTLGGTEGAALEALEALAADSGIPLLDWARSVELQRQHDAQRLLRNEAAFASLRNNNVNVD
jgi:hypothetical protein